MINKVIQIATEAGAIVREGFGKNFSVEYKTNASNLVTEIDKKSEAAIIAFINKEFPLMQSLLKRAGLINRLPNIFGLLIRLTELLTLHTDFQSSAFQSVCKKMKKLSAVLSMM